MSAWKTIEGYEGMYETERPSRKSGELQEKDWMEEE